MIKSLIWESLKRSCIEYFGLVDGKDINNSELTIKFPNGVFIRCKSAEQRENLRGLNVGVWVADEAALYTQDTLQEITNRLRPKVGQPDTFGRLIVISTPSYRFFLQMFHFLLSILRTVPRVSVMRSSAVFSSVPLCYQMSRFLTHEYL